MRALHSGNFSGGGSTDGRPVAFPGSIIGTEGGAGWGSEPAQTIIGGSITWDRVEIGAPPGGVARALRAGSHHYRC